MGRRLLPWIAAGLLALPAWGFDAAHTLPATGTVELAFTPDEAADRRVIRAIDGARRQVLVQAFSFTHEKIADALIRAKQRGVAVEIIADAEQTEKIPTTQIPRLAAARIPVYLDREHGAAHNKVMVVDLGDPQAAVVTGSYNFTHAAQYRNAENLLVLRGNPPLTEAYVRNWQRHRLHALPYNPRP